MDWCRLLTHLSSLPPIEVLYRLRKHHPEVFGKMEIYIDGGITRGSGKCPVLLHFNDGLQLNICSDVLKAVCLGATAVGLGRPYLYAQGVSYCALLYQRGELTSDLLGVRSEWREENYPHSRDGDCHGDASHGCVKYQGLDA